LTEGKFLETAEIIERVNEKIEKVRTRSLDLSFNEILDMISNGELTINPDYQRLFRWSEGKQSRFIESLILEMPIPPIFVIEKSEGSYELIDGLQRISSYLHFRGKHPEKGEGHFLQLSECDIVHELNGLSFSQLPKSLEIKLKRNFIRVEILRKESDSRLRYYMFKRLNTGGEILSDQEIRNCTIRLLDNRFNEFIMNESTNPDFIECVSQVSDERKIKKYDQELVLRFFSFKNWRDHYQHDVGDFMTEYMESVSDSESDVDFDYDGEKIIFEKTFKILNMTMGEHSFSSLTPKGKFASRFLSYYYEAFTLGIQPHLAKIDLTNAGQLGRLSDVFKKIKGEGEFIEMTTGGGKNYAGPLQNRIKFVNDRVPSAL
jgi:hypothetical protein